MKFQELNFHKTPKYFTWNLVQLPSTTKDPLWAQWCNQHQSSGRFYLRKSEKKAPGLPWEHFTDWYFENEDDALLFALKFT